MRGSAILVVDDEQILAFTLQQQLTISGYVPTIVASGKEALQQIKASPPDLVLMDISLDHEMDGIETAVQIQKFAKIPIVYLTAYTSDKIIERAKTTEPFGYLVKPVKPAEMHTTIEMALYKYECYQKLKLLNQQLQDEMSKHQQTEEERLKLEQQLEHERKMSAVGKMAGGVSNDMNNMLTPIFGYVEMLTNLFSEDSREQRYLKGIETASKRLANMARQILTFSRMEVTRTPLNMATVIQEELGTVKTRFPDHIEIKQVLKKDCSPVMANAIEIHQLILNLCDNAKQAIGKSEGQLIVSLTQLEDCPPHLCVGDGGLPQGECVKLMIADTGCGIEPEHLEKVFDPFFTTREVGQGKGLGLSIVHGIVEHHNGKIMVESQVGQGTTFSIFFPIVDQE